jgi:putative drug exporter of the RND superfamily
MMTRRATVVRNDGMSRVARSGRYLTWVALGLWVVAAVLLTPLAGRTSEVVSTDVALTLPLSAEATQELNRERAAFPGADRPVAVVVYARDSGITPQDRSAVEADRAAFAGLSLDSQVGPAVLSRDGRALLLSFPVAAVGQEEAKTVVDRITDQLADTPTGLATAVTGSAGALADVADALGGVDTTLLLAAAIVVAVLLLLTYRSPVLWLLPLVSVGLASQFAGGVVYLLGKHAGVTITGDASGMMVVLVFGAGTDYALLLIARYREELHRHADRYTAMAVALRRSFPAILASAGTVTVGMLCLLAAHMNDVRGLGPVAATGIVIAFAVMTTLLPALLVLLGRWVFWPFVPRYVPGTGASMAQQHGIWRRVADTVGRRPRVIWIAATLALVALSSGVFGLRAGQAADQAYTTEVGSVVGQRLIDEHYASGTSNPARLIAAADHADEVVAAAAAVEGVAQTRQSGVSADGRWARIEAVLDDPPDSAAAKDTIVRLRQSTHDVPGADAVVGGQTATTMDIERAARRDNQVLLPLILIVVFAVLVLLLRALVAPLLLAASVVLSYAAAMGVAGLLFQALGHPGIIPSLPLFGYLFLVTLGVDYTIFLMTRAREEVAKVGNREGVLSALTVTGGVITSAGLVLAATFATLIVLPLVTALHIGLIVATGVLLDTFVVRTLLIPALAVDLGSRIWWPSRLARRPAGPPRPAEPGPVEPRPSPEPAGVAG